MPDRSISDPFKEIRSVPAWGPSSKAVLCEGQTPVLCEGQLGGRKLSSVEEDTSYSSRAIHNDSRSRTINGGLKNER